MGRLRVLNTRPIDQTDTLDQIIQELGGISIHLPTLTMSASHSDWLSEIPPLATVNQTIFISANAVNYFFTALKQISMPWPTTITMITVGHATAAALSRWGFQAHHIPSIADSEHVLKLDVLQDIKNQSILLIKGQGGRPLIAETLRFRGARLMSLSVYRRELPAIKQEYINSVWQDDAVDIILFTSQQSMQNLFTLFTDKGRAWIQNKPCLVISDRLAEEASILGIKTIINCRYDDISNALFHYKKGLTHDNPQ